LTSTRATSGITPVSFFFGAVRNQDRVRSLFDLVAAT
jgi:hypothetical protein